MKISVAMATYNGGEYLAEQLDSFAVQTRPPDELVVSDDCSTDHTIEIVERFADRAPFEVLWSRNETNLGYAGNFNAALTRTTGDLVFLSDQDDVWFPEKIETILTHAERHPEALVLMNDAQMTNACLQPFGVSKLGQIRDGGFGETNFVMGCCAAIDREFLDWVLPVPTVGVSHDDWIVGIAVALDRRLIIERVLQYYRRHGSNESQGIFNRTAPLSRLGAVLMLIANRLAVLRASRGEETVGQGSWLVAEQVLEELERVRLRAPERYHDGLDQYIRSRRAWLQLGRQRAELRSRPVPARFAGGLQAWFRGDYKNCSGVLSLLRDLYGGSSNARRRN